MKRLLLILLLAALAGNINKSFSWDTTAAKYLPLQVGNIWVYEDRFGYPYSECYAYHKYQMSGTIQINGKIYFQISSTVSYSYNCTQQAVARIYENGVVRFDSATSNVYTSESCGVFGLVPIDSLNAVRLDTSTTCTGTTTRREVCDTGTTNIFGMIKQRKAFFIPHAAGSEYQFYAKDIGLYEYGWIESFQSMREYLKGCVLNGIVYGDTSMLVGINQISSEIPDQYFLSQNYPNPFNPTTNIKFQIPKTGFVKLTVFDVLGKEIEILVNQQLSPGTYQVDFEGTNLPSGVYYYQLTISNEQLSMLYNETKKMVLIK